MNRYRTHKSGKVFHDFNFGSHRVSREDIAERKNKGACYCCGAWFGKANEGHSYQACPIYQPVWNTNHAFTFGSDVGRYKREILEKTTPHFVYHRTSDHYKREREQEWEEAKKRRDKWLFNREVLERKGYQQSEYDRWDGRLQERREARKAVEGKEYHKNSETEK